MGTSKVTIFLVPFIVLCFQMTLLGQTEHVDIYNPVYRFLERMENHHILTRYNAFEIPKSRKEIASFIREIILQEQKLSSTDRRILEDLKTEFEAELYDTNKNSLRIIENNGYDLLSEKQKFLYFINEDQFDMYINLYADLGYIHRNIKDRFNNNASLGNIGGIIRGNIADKFGFYLRGSNGKTFGNSVAAIADRRLAQNFKFTERPDETFYDETEGYITADFNIIRFKFGRDMIRLGYGETALVDDYSPYFDYLGISLNYNFFSYSFIHAKMLDIGLIPGQPVIDDKFLVFHRIGIDINRHFNFGAGEFIIYGRRGIDLSYLNPFAFYKSVEHSNRDRDNSMLFFDFSNNSIPRTKLHLTFLLDDITYSKAGTGWYGNQVMLNTGVITSDIAGLPVDLSLDYRRTEPYTFSHRIPHNNFTNFGYSISTYAMPNSELFSGTFSWRLNYRLEISSGITYIIHGANPVTEQGIINVGGDINLGHRDTDSEIADFLSGVKEYYRNYKFSILYEPVNQMFFRFNIRYFNNSTQSELSQKEIQSFLTLTTVL
jgi:hypothetical protein